MSDIYDWEEIDAEWCQCRRTGKWLSKSQQWLYTFEEKENTFLPYCKYEGPAHDVARSAVPSFRDSLDAALSSINAGCLHNISVITGSATMQGRRPAQEDRYVINGNIFATDKTMTGAGAQHWPNGPWMCFVVADGHSGSKAAEFAVETLPLTLASNIIETIKTTTYPNHQRGCKRSRDTDEDSLNARKVPKTQDLEPSKHNVSDEATTSDAIDPSAQEPITETGDTLAVQLKDVVTSTFESVDKQFLAEYRTSIAGATVTLALLMGNLLVVGNCGDSRAILATASETPRQWEPIRVTVDHKPSQPFEIERVIKAGGSIVVSRGIPRVYNANDTKVLRPIALAVTRAFGDRHLKLDSILISKPHVATFYIDPLKHSALIIASDGVWDVLSDTAVQDIVLRHHQSNNARAAAGEIVSTAFACKSYDNITAIVVFFYPDEREDESTAEEETASDQLPSVEHAPVVDS